MSLVLEPSSRIAPSTGPLLLVIMDGVGVGRGDAFDAVSVARTPTLDHLAQTASYRTLRAHGTAVGLPGDGDMGNSEVGHNALGAGRIFDQGAKLAGRSVEDGSIFRTDVWRRIAERCVGGGGSLHLIGLLSDGNVHSHQSQLHGILAQAGRESFPSVFVHVLLDGRDVPETSALDYVGPLEEHLERVSPEGRRYRIASGGGRMLTTMDRYEADWSIVERGWNAHVHGKARGFASAREAVETYRAEEPGIIDQNLPPFVVVDGGEPVGRVKDGDCVVLFNFRGDRALEISRAFDGGDDFDAFDRGDRPEVLFAGMTLYDADLGIPAMYLVQPPAIDRTMGEYLAAGGVSQYALSETQKYGHVTYFWNGNRGGLFDPGTETYEEIPSDRVSFDERPWMKAAEIADRTIAALRSGRHRFLRINFPNGDMVGHTGRFDPTVISMEALDLSLGRIVREIDRLGSTLIVTADHGNAEDMVERDREGKPRRHPGGRPRSRTSHTTNPVPFYLYRADGTRLPLRDDLDDGGLANVAATTLELLGFAPPSDYMPSLLA